jgi:AcrR family transcriptional regulator
VTAAPRPRLDRDRALRAAIALADEGGMGAVTMRKLAARLGVEAMSLYHHVASKDDLLDGMVDLVFAEVHVPEPGAGWREAMRQRTTSMRQTLADHPWAIGLMESRRSPGPATLRHHDAVLGCLRTAGFSVTGAGHAFALLDSYVYGFALQEATLPFDDTDSMPEVVGEILPDLDGSMGHQLPHLAEFARQRVVQPGYSFGDEFDFGLELILDGLEQRLA